MWKKKPAKRRRTQTSDPRRFDLPRIPATQLPQLPIGTWVQAHSTLDPLPESQVIGVKKLTTNVIYELGYITPHPRRRRQPPTITRLGAAASPENITVLGFMIEDAR
ncbi:hypothetical protein [Brachybacterium sp. YJGR34]|uniref:hypothetical protein n=1 Tax=Brachybacterium TaxID=43668 RepID=UPI000E0C3F0F|nr:hypothetical protein [Brachybacterium sp. YJGR34]